MGRLITIFTGQRGGDPLEDIAKEAGKGEGGIGYDGMELACWGDHFDVKKALAETNYCPEKWKLLEKHELQCHAISAHLVGQAVCDDPIDTRHKGILPPEVWGDGDPEGVRQRAAERMKDTARAARKFGVKTVCGFTGSKIWHLWYDFPPIPAEMITDGFQDFADRWDPILDVFGEGDVRFALEVHPGEIAFGIETAKRALEAVDNRPEFGFNLDASHLIWQGIDPVEFIRTFPDRIYHVHMKDAATNNHPAAGVLGDMLSNGDRRRGWNFRSLGHGDVDNEAVIRALNDAGYTGPLSVEWEDNGMEWGFGARDALRYLRSINFAPSNVAFDAAFTEAEK